jgi:APA family basic amino acid/polyamine antiporter
MIPVSGSAYVYTYATMGEFMAWLMGWVLMLEYAIGTIAVATSWTGYFVQLLQGFPFLPDCVKSLSFWVHNVDILGLTVSINIPAITIILILALIVLKGMQESTNFAKIMVIIKIAVIAIFVIVGAFYVKPDNWTPFVPNGIKGIELGIFTIFYAYVGFDAISTAAEETKNPQKDLPIGIIGSLLITTIVYVLVALVLTGLQPTSGVAIPEGLLKAPMAYAMSAVGQNWVAGLISIGSIAGLTSVLLVLQMAATRVLFAMSRDNFLPKVFQKTHKKFNTPHILTITVGLLGIIGTLFLDLDVAASLCNFGTFTSFIIVCVAILILRKIDPDRERPFKVPFCPWFPLMGIICCGGLMIYSMIVAKGETATLSSLLFVAWVAIGALIYATYGYRKNREAELTVNEVGNNEQITSNI